MTVYAVAIVNSEGSCESMYIPGGVFDDEGAWQHDASKTVVHITTQLSDQSAFMQTKYYKDGVWKDREKSSGDYYNWVSEAWVLDSTKLWKNIREDRDIRLWKSDWTQMSDCKLSITKQGEWTEYRQALRDVPSSNEGATHTDQIVWPDMPS